MSAPTTVTKKDIKDLRQELKQDMRSASDDILGVLDVMMTRIDIRFTNIGDELEVHRKEIQQILRRLDHIDKQLETSEQERLIMGHQLERLDKWIHELADRIGYKLPI